MTQARVADESSAATGGGLRRRRRRASPGEIAERFGLVGVFVVIIAIFSALKPDTYPTAANAQSIAATQAVVAVLALAALMPLVVGQFDVSIGFQLGLGQALCAGLIIRQGVPEWVAVITPIVACGVVGVINGLLVMKVRLNSFIATLGTGTLVLGFTQLYSGDSTISGRFSSLFTTLGRGEAAGIPLAFIYVIVLCIALWLLFEYTSWGRSAHAIGGNERAALLSGIAVDKVALQCFIGAGLLSGLAGSLSVMVLGSSSPTVGLGSLLPAFAAAFLGATAIRPGRFNSIGTILAVYVLASGITGLQQLGADFYVQQLFNGGALVIAVSISSFAARRRR